MTALHCVVLAILAAFSLDGPVVLEGEAFRVHVHFDAPEVGREVLAIADSTWTVAAEAYGLEAPPEAKFDVHLYRDSAAYEAVDQDLAEGRFRRNLAFAHWDTKSAHVALQPPLADETLAAVGLPALTARLLAHEMAHLVRMHAMPNFRSHPGWFVDGMASWIDARVMQRLGRIESIERDPQSGAAITRLQTLAREEQLQSVDDLLLGRSEALAFGERYGIRWLFVEMLQDRHAKTFARTIAEIRRLGGGEGFTERVHEAFKDVFRSSFAKLDRDFKSYLASLQPEWDEQLRSLETAGTEWTQIAWDDTHAMAWRKEQLGREDFEVTGTCTFLPAPEHQMNLRFGRLGGFVQVSVTGGYGVNVFRYDGEWAMHAKMPVQGILVGEEIPFRVRYVTREQRLSVELSGRQVMETDIQIDPVGSLGLGAQAGSAVVWKTVEFGRP